jgi:uncharacterized membrane protein
MYVAAVLYNRYTPPDTSVCVVVYAVAELYSRFMPPTPPDYSVCVVVYAVAELYNSFMPPTPPDNSFYTLYLYMNSVPLCNP